MAAMAAPAATAAETKTQDCNPFRQCDVVVCPTHGAGRVERVGFEQIAGHWPNLIRILFTDNQVTLRVPIAQVRGVGRRRLASPQTIAAALAKLTGRPGKPADTGQARTGMSGEARPRSSGRTRRSGPRSAAGRRRL
jgi:RNA polymerase-interacting CarD/CdnL/TRCF family regulator